MPVQTVKVDPGNPPHRRFYQLPEVAAMLATSKAQVYALVRNGDLPAIKLGGRGQWRIEQTQLDDWIAARYRDTRRYIAENPLYGGDNDDHPR